MFRDLKNSLKIAPDNLTKNIIFGPNVIPKLNMISIPSGWTKIGADFHEIHFGWDNEFPSQNVHVPSFSVSQFPVTNGEFLQFVESGEYNNPNHWKEEDWKWKGKVGLQYPHCWSKQASTWYYRTIFEEIPLHKVLDYPVYVSQAEAVKLIFCFHF